MWVAGPVADVAVQRSSDLGFWGLWVAANCFAELIGLGGAGAASFAAIVTWGEPDTVLLAAAFAALAIGLGAFEGAMVGWAQARVLRRRLPGLRGWVGATVLGAVIAWTLGMLPSTIVSLTSAATAPPPVMSDWAQLALAVPLGLVAGVILAIPQWRVLRRYVKRAGLWLLANTLAWAVGMPLVFVAAGVRPEGSPLTVALLVLGSLATAGAAVGAIHGAFLCWLTRAP
jgi:hypothetical protein